MNVSRQFPASRLEFAGYCLRPFQISDAPALVEAIEESLEDLKPFMPWAHVPQTLDSQVRRIREMLSSNAEGPDFSFGLFREQRFLAACGLHPRVPLNPNGTEIGFWTRSSAAGQGLATLMTRVLIVYAVEGLAMDRIQIGHNLENVRSRRVVERCGFVPEGIGRNELPPPTSEGQSLCRDMQRYSLLPHEARALSWYSEVARSLRVFNQVGEDLGFAWEPQV